MKVKDLLELIEEGENSSLEFKQDGTHPDKLAKEITAMLNFQGGYLLLGIDDDGTIIGILETAKKAEEHIMNICDQNIDPPIIPHWQCITVNGRNVGIISIPDDAPDKPYKAKYGSKWISYIRMGTTSREATREQEGRLYYASPLSGSFVVKPVLNAGLKDLEMKRVYDYFATVRQQDVPDIDKTDKWEKILFNTELLAQSQGRNLPSVAAILLFGIDPHRFLKSSGISVCAFDGIDKTAPLKESNLINAPFIPLLGTNKKILFPGLVEETLDFIRRNIHVTEDRSKGRREQRWDYPLNALREIVLNAFIHRNYTIPCDVELAIYTDRIEIISPGSLPNTINVTRMKSGCRASRNELLKDIMRDYKYVEDLGMGICYTVIPQMMKHNGTEPEFIEQDERLKVILYKGEF